MTEFRQAIDILPGCYVGTSYELRERSLFKVGITVNAPLNVFVMDNPSYCAYGGASVCLYRGPGRGAVNPIWTSPLGPGRFWLVLENPGRVRLIGTAEVAIL